MKEIVGSFKFYFKTMSEYAFIVEAMYCSFEMMSCPWTIAADPNILLDDSLILEYFKNCKFPICFQFSAATSCTSRK